MFKLRPLGEFLRLHPIDTFLVVTLDILQL